MYLKYVWLGIAKYNHNKNSWTLISCSGTLMALSQELGL